MSKRTNSKAISLGDLCQITGGGTPTTTVLKYWEGSIPWVSPKDMKSEIVSDSIDHVSEEAINNSATNEHRPFVLLSRDGQRWRSGRSVSA